MRLRFLAMAAAVLVACGGSSSGGNPNLGDADAGDTGSDVPDSGSPDAGPVDAGLPPPDAGPADAGPPAPDAGPVTPDAGPVTTDECTGLLPASLPPPVIPDISCANTCLASLSDDVGGNFLLHYETMTGEAFDDYAFVSVRDGKAANLGGFGSTDEFPSQFFTEPSGFTETFAAPGRLIRTFSPSGVEGNVTTFGQDDRVVIAPDPSGGFVALVWSADPANSALAQITWQRFDKSGKAVSVPLTIERLGVDTNLIGAGVTLAGNTLLELFSTVDGSQAITSAIWIDKNGAPMTTETVVPTSTLSPSFQFLFGGGLVEGVANGEFSRVWTEGAAQPSALPAWLKARSSASLSAIREGAGYAALGTCAGVEVLAKSGKSCGCLAVPGLNAASSVGRDGSLIVPASPRFELYPLLFR